MFIVSLVVVLRSSGALCNRKHVAPRGANNVCEWVGAINILLLRSTGRIFSEIRQYSDIVNFFETILRGHNHEVLGLFICSFFTNAFGLFKFETPGGGAETARLSTIS